MPSDDFFIRRYVRERDRGDMTRALEIWEELVVRSFDRVRVQVRTFRFPGGQRLDARHHDDATAAAFTRVYQLGTNFRGHTAAEFRAAAAAAVWHAVMDFGRAQMQYEKGIAGSLDERYAEADDSG